MIILPPKTDLPAKPIERQHQPRPGAYPTYRQCLRWEFGFHCAFCFLHEADLIAHGVEGSGLTGIEHHLPRSHAPHREDEYGNCFYACRFCNGARAGRPNVDSRGRSLLEPCSTAWATRFERQDDHIRPRDADAEYTAEAYDLNDLRKRQMRSSRAETIALGLRILSEWPGRIRRLLLLAERVATDDRRVVLDAAENLSQQLVAARKELERFRFDPTDSEEDCRCGVVRKELPSFLAAQGIELPT